MNIRMSLLISFVLLMVFSNALAEPIVQWGEAKNASGATVYFEKHSILIKNGVLQSSETIYYDVNRQKEIGTMRSDYTKSLAKPTYDFVDLRSGYREGLRLSDSKYIVYYKKPDQEEKVKNLKDGESVFSCQGWHYYLLENLSVLEKQDITLNLVLPSELDFYSFKVRRAESSGTQIVAHLELSSWLLSFFAPKLQLVYDKELKRLIEYKGISNILDAKGDRQEVTIHYQYEGHGAGSLER